MTPDKESRTYLLFYEAHKQCTKQTCFYQCVAFVIPFKRLLPDTVNYTYSITSKRKKNFLCLSACIFVFAVFAIPQTQFWCYYCDKQQLPTSVCFQRTFSMEELQPVVWQLAVWRSCSNYNWIFLTQEKLVHCFSDFNSCTYIK